MKKTLFISAAILLLLTFMGGALYFKAEQSEEASQRITANAAALEGVGAPQLGEANARVTVVEFLDPACETCRSFYPFVKELMAAHPGQIRLVLRYTPLHENADQVAAMLLAAGLQGKHGEALVTVLARQNEWVEHHVARPERVLPMLKGLGLDMARLRRDMASPEVTGQIAQNMADARALGVSKTPEFFVNGQPLPEFGYEPLQTLVETAITETYR